jgi:uncharacterized protein YjlB
MFRARRALRTADATRVPVRGAGDAAGRADQEGGRNRDRPGAAAQGYDFLHFHTRLHEVLGIARGRARVQFGGDKGRTPGVKAGGVIVLPAGTGHRRLSAGGDLLVVGACPASSGQYDEPTPGGCAGSAPPIRN